MWFKNLRLYRLTDDWTVNEDRLNEALAQFPFTGLSALQESTFGWVPPFGDSNLLCESVAGRLFMAAQIQEKLLPASVLKEHLEEKIVAVEEAEGRRPGRKEKEALKEAIRAELLPRAFHKTRRVSLWIDPSRHWLVLNAASEKTADEVTAQLRDAIGSLPIVPLGKLIAGGDLLTAWYHDPARRPEGTELSADLELVMAQDPTVKARYRNLDLDAPEIRHSLDSGMRIRQLGIVMNDQCQAVIDDAFALKRLKYSDTLVESNGDSDDPRTDTLLMSDTLTAWLTALEPQITEPGV